MGFILRSRIAKYIISVLTHLHTESPATFNKLSNVPLTLAVAPGLREKLEDKSS